MAEVFAERAAAKKALYPLIDYYRNAEAKEASATTTVADLIAAIRSDEFKSKVENIRVHRAAGNKKQADIDKRELPAVSISGATTGLRKSAVPDGRFTHSGYLQIDIDGKDVRITTSIGLAALEKGEDFDALFARADAALYAAKHGGRNRVQVAEFPAAPDRL
jgi:GGDEF domain-containing protein